MEDLSFRDQAVSSFEDAFGPPQIVQTVDGPLFRWVLRSSDGSHIRITIDSPEFPQIAHVLVSDRTAAQLVTSSTLREMDEVYELIRRLRDRLTGTTSS